MAGRNNVASDRPALIEENCCSGQSVGSIFEKAFGRRNLLFDCCRGAPVNDVSQVRPEPQHMQEEPLGRVAVPLAAVAASGNAAGSSPGIHDKSVPYSNEEYPPGRASDWQEEEAMTLPRRSSVGLSHRLEETSAGGACAGGQMNADFAMTVAVSPVHCPPSDTGVDARSTTDALHTKRSVGASSVGDDPSATAVKADVPRRTPRKSPRESKGKAKKTSQVELQRRSSEKPVDVDGCEEFGFETFACSFSLDELPVIAFSDDLTEQRIWRCGKLVEGRILLRLASPDMSVPHPVMMSPAMCGLALQPTDWRYVHYSGVGILFSRPSGATFMQPSIDTVLVCRALAVLFEEDGCSISKAVDIGSGSGFIGKFIGAKAPGDGPLSVTLVDIDPLAKEYCASTGFNSVKHGCNGREVALAVESGDACELLGREGGGIGDFDLLVSNPPYIPKIDEGKTSAALASPTGFWEGIGLVVHLIDMVAKRKTPPGGRDVCLVIMITSLTLKAPAVRASLGSAFARGLKVRILVEKEVAWKAFYAGPTSGGIDHLLASAEERTQKRPAGGCDFFVGATKPGESREGTSGRDMLKAYHWHVAYVLALHR